MSDTYRLLRDGLPDYNKGAQGQFHSEARKVRTWVEALPRANAAATQMQLKQALENLAGQKLSSTTRLAALEELRPAVLEQCRLLEGSYATSPLPLLPEMARNASSAEDFQLLLGHAYRQAAADICAPSGSIPFLKSGSVATALVRSAMHYSRSLLLVWRIYHPPRAAAWQGLHRTYRFACELKLETKTVDDPQTTGGAHDVLDIYQQALLVAITNPYGYSQSEQDEMWKLVRAYHGRCGLHRSIPHGNAPVIPEDADHGPGSSREGEAASLWLDLRPFIDDVERALSQLQEGFANLVPGRGVSMRLSEDELWRLKRAFGLNAARRYPRLSASHSIDSIVGLSALHFYLAGQRDFDTFLRQSTQAQVHVIDRASWAVGGGDVQRMPRLSAQAMDQSLGGYRLVWRSAEQARIRIGELIGLTFTDPDEAPEWMVAVVRWLRYETDGSLSAGVELLSRRSCAVAMRTGLEAAGVSLRALELSNDNGQRRFIAPSSLDGHAARIEIVMADAASGSGEATTVRSHLEQYRFTMNTGEYVLLHAGNPLAEALA